MWELLTEFMQTWYFWLLIAVLYLTAGYYAWDLGDAEKVDDEDDFTVLNTLFLPAVLLIGWACALIVKVFGWSEDVEK